MTGFDNLVALVAMMPAAINPSLAVEQESLSGIMCGSGASISIPLGPPRLPGTLPSACCAKGCHGKRRGHHEDQEN